MSDKYAALKSRIEKALEDFTNGRASMHVPVLDTDVDLVLYDCLDLLAEREADKARIAELTGKPPEDYPDDSELCFVIDECDCLADYQTAQWLKELRRRRAAGITLETGEKS